MVVLLSPARGFHDPNHGILPPLTRPALLTKTKKLAHRLKQYSPWELETILGTSPELALKAWAMGQSFDKGEKLPALAAYRGLVYQYINAADLRSVDFLYAQKHLRILSAFYGILRPLDGIVPYRLELVSRLRIDGKNLYQFWGDAVYRQICRGEEPIINLCSAEYAKLITPYLVPQNRFISCDFLVSTPRGYRCITTTAKAARGRMARFVLDERLAKPEALQEFTDLNFSYTPELSSPDRYVFVQQDDTADRM